MDNMMVVNYLNYLVKTYDGVTQLIVSTKQRLQTLPGIEKDTNCDTLLKGQDKLEGLETVKGRIVRALEKELPQWDIWEQWMQNVPGIGPAIAARLIVLYYYKFMPICKKCEGELNKEEGTMVCASCGHKASADGLLQYKINFRDFPTISKWWAFMGRHTVDGIMPKRAKGKQSNWSTPGRTLGFQIGDQFNRQKDDHPYKAFMLSRKAKHVKNHADWTKGHVHNAARNEAVKLFLAHFWTVARILDGKPISEPYAGTIMGHTNIIAPFYWPEEVTKIAAAN